MLKKIIIAIGIISIISISSALPLEVPNEERECHKWGTQTDLFMCFVRGTGEYAKWFYNYPDMHDYYTPQLKEINISAGDTYTLTANRKNPTVLMVTGSPSYLYVKHT